MIRGLLGYVLRGLSRHFWRSLLTALGVATAMFLFCFIEGLQTGVREATEHAATQNVVVVYQKGRFCPATSNIPQRYADTVRRMPEVESVLPIKIYVNNCRASLDSVTFKGVPVDEASPEQLGIEMVAGDTTGFQKKQNGALVGERLAARRNLKPGSQFQIGNVLIDVSGIFKTERPGEDNVAYVNLDYLQRGQGVNSQGLVTQLEVRLKDATTVDSVSEKIDATFKSDQTPTITRSHKAHMKAATGPLLGLIGFTRLLGWISVLTVLGLTGNTIYIMVQDRVKEHAVLQTLGFQGWHLFFMVIAESLVLSLIGGVIGTGAAALALEFGKFGIGAEGVQITFILTPALVVAGLLVSSATGMLAGLVPALQAATSPIVQSLRRV